MSMQMKGKKARIYIIGFVFALLLVAMVAGLTVSNGILQKPTHINVKTILYDCRLPFTYSVTLTDAQKNPLANELVDVYVNEVLSESLLTDQNGRFTSLAQGMCSDNTIRVLYKGNTLHAASTSIAVVGATNNQQQTFVLINAPTQATQGTHPSLLITVYDSTTNKPLANAEVTTTIGDKQKILTTDERGIIQTSFEATHAGTMLVRALYNGNERYAQSVDTKEVFVSPSKTNRIAQLQKSIVQVEQPKGDGSGIVLAHENGNTIILTNNHVIEDTPSINAVKIVTPDDQTVSAMSIRQAPHGMDLAIVTIKGTYGQVASIETEETAQGEAVLVMGSPMGFHGTVTSGILSNYVDYTTKQGYKYETIQTDAAINVGVSGGGLFREDTGSLIGVNSFKYKSSEGLGFAINIKELDRLPPKEKWSLLQP
jgi:S1-C subfamily serine protease